MARVVVLVIAAATLACGRIDFDERGDDGSGGDAGSDAGPEGYVWMESTAAFAPPAGAQLVPGFMNGDDETTYVLQLPFTFPFYGVGHDTVTVSVNGYVTFEAPIMGDENFYNECPLDGTLPTGIIAVFWDDVFATMAATPLGSISYATAGSTNDPQFVIEWRDLDAWYWQGQMWDAQGSRVTHQLILHADGRFDMHYGPRRPPLWDRDCGVDRHRGCSATVGVKPPAGAPTLVQCGTSAGPGAGYTPIDEGRRVTFTPRL